MITVNVIQRVFHIKWEMYAGTAFTVDVDQRQYLITARHVVSTKDDETPIDIFHDAQWKRMRVRIIHLLQEDVDIVVLAPSFQISPTLPLEPTAGGLILGQEVFFLGFPYGLFADSGLLNRQFPFPFVKRGTLSAFDPKVGYIFIDGHNNPGFSGGPIVFRLQNTKNFRVAGVVSGYRFEEEPILSRNSNQDTNFYYQYNTGIALGWDIKFAIDAIKTNPIGFPLSGSSSSR